MKICRNCVHCDVDLVGSFKKILSNFIYIDYDNHDMCREDQNLNPITGNKLIMLCEEARGLMAPCGPDGNLFKSRDRRDMDGKV